MTKNMGDKIIFPQEGLFQAQHAAEKWLRERGFSIGSSQAGSPRAIWHGDCYISKWRGLSPAERASCHALMTGNGRNGPITVALTPAASPEAIAAFSREEPAQTATAQTADGEEG